MNSILNRYNFDIRNTALNSFGYYIHRFKPVDFLPSDNDIFSIPISKCVAQSYFSYAKDGWHYYDALVREYQEDNNLKYEDSILHKYYSAFRPKNFREALFDDDTLIDSVLSKLPNVAIREFWSLNGTLDQIRTYLIKEETQLFGPISELYGMEQFRRCVRAYQLIKKHGYLPNKFFDGYIKGFFIKKASDYRFCVIAGKHRLAALNVLGYDSIKVKASYLLKVVDVAHLNHVPIVKSGLCTEEIADILAQRYFSETGRGRAQSLGLLSNKT